MKPTGFTAGMAGPATLVSAPTTTAGFGGVGFGGLGVVGVGVVGVGVVGVGVTVAQGVLVIVSVSSVSAPAPFACAPASSRPATVTLFYTEMLVLAMTVPTKVAPVFKVAELLTCQKTLHAWAPPERTTRLPVSAISVDADWKIQTELASPWSVSVSPLAIPSEAGAPSSL